MSALDIAREAWLEALAEFCQKRNVPLDRACKEIGDAIEAIRKLSGGRSSDNRSVAIKTADGTVERHPVQVDPKAVSLIREEWADDLVRLANEPAAPEDRRQTTDQQLAHRVRSEIAGSILPSKDPRRAAQRLQRYLESDRAFRKQGPVELDRAYVAIIAATIEHLADKVRRARKDMGDSKPYGLDMSVIVTTLQFARAQLLAINPEPYGLPAEPNTETITAALKALHKDAVHQEAAKNNITLTDALSIEASAREVHFLLRQHD